MSKFGENVHSCHNDWCKVVVMFCISVSAADQVILPRLLHNCSSDGSSSGSRGSKGSGSLGRALGQRRGTPRTFYAPLLSSAALSCHRFFRVKCCLSASPLEKGPEVGGGEMLVSAASGGGSTGPV